MIRGWRYASVPVLTFLYAFCPGDPGGILPGPPWRLAGALVLLCLVGAALLLSDAEGSGRRHGIIGALLVVALAARVAMAPAILPRGWSSTYFVDLEGPQSLSAERIGRRAEVGGVIDRRPILNEQSNASHFNDDVFASGGPNRALIRPWQARWQGFLLLDREALVDAQVTGNGSGWIQVDNELTLLPDDAPTAQTTTIQRALAPGLHRFEVGYRKASNEPPSFALELHDAAGRPLTVFANRPDRDRLRRDRWARGVILLSDVLVLCLAVWWLLHMIPVGLARIRALRWPSVLDTPFGRRVVTAAMLTGFMVQGLFMATARTGLAVFANGDDMRTYAAGGRDIVFHGLLMNHGQPLGSGEPFFFYPLYNYFVALAHLLFDESLFGLIVLQFLLLGMTVALLMRLAHELFGAAAAWWSLAGMVLLTQVDFVRWYTVSVFSDNLYYPMVVAMLLVMGRLADSPRWGTAMWAGLLCGLGALTRPSMMTFFPLAAAWLLWTGRKTVSRRRRAGQLGVFAAAWMAMVGLATLRNLLVSGRFVLLVDSFIQVLVQLAPENVSTSAYFPTGLERFPSALETLHGAWRMIQDYPLGTMQALWNKLVFIIGFTNVHGYKLHPEFVLLSASYLAWWTLARKQTAYLAAVHLFIFSHIIAMMISAPWNYGYRILLTSMMLLVPFGANVIGELVRIVKVTWLNVRARTATGT